MGQKWLTSWVSVDPSDWIEELYSWDYLTGDQITFLRNNYPEEVKGVFRLTKKELKELSKQLDLKDPEKIKNYFVQQERETITSSEILPKISKTLLENLDRAFRKRIFAEDWPWKHLDAVLNEDTKWGTASWFTLCLIQKLSEKGEEIKNIPSQLVAVFNFLKDKKDFSSITKSTKEIKEATWVFNIGEMLNHMYKRIEIIEVEGIENWWEKNIYLMDPIKMAELLGWNWKIDLSKWNRESMEDYMNEKERTSLIDKIRNDANKLNGIKINGKWLLDQLWEQLEIWKKTAQSYLNGSSNPWFVEFLKNPPDFLKKIIAFFVDLLGIDLEVAFENSAIKRIVEESNKIANEKINELPDAIKKYIVSKDVPNIGKWEEKGEIVKISEFDKSFWSKDDYKIVSGLERVSKVWSRGNSEDWEKEEWVWKIKALKVYSEEFLLELFKNPDFLAKLKEVESKSKTWLFAETIKKMLKMSKYKKGQKDEKEQKQVEVSQEWDTQQEEKKEQAGEEQVVLLEEGEVDNASVSPEKSVTLVLNEGVKED